MDPKLIALLALRVVGQTTGNVAVANGVEALLGAYQAGTNVDAHLQAIAGKLEAGTLLDSWEDIQIRIDAEVDDFLN